MNWTFSGIGNLGWDLRFSFRDWVHALVSGWVLFGFGSVGSGWTGLGWLVGQNENNYDSPLKAVFLCFVIVIL